MANSNGWGDGASNNSIGWGQGANNNIGWGDSHATSWAGATDIVGLTTDADATAFLTASAITGATQQAAIDNLVKGLKSDGLWSKMKAVYPFVTDNRNLLGYTEQFNNGYWTLSSVGITPNSTISPDGALTADTFVETATGGIHYVGKSQNPITLGLTTISVFAKSNGTRNWVYIYDDSQAKGKFFDVANGVVGSNMVGAPTSASITSVGNGWYRCSITINYTNTNSNLWFGLGSADGVFSYTGNGTSGAVFWGAQMELGSTATTYQPILTTQQAYIASQFKYNLVNPVDSDAAFRLVFNGGWTHSSTGATPNGTNGYADTKLVPSSVLALNSSHISGYTRTNTSVLAPLLSSENATSYANGIFIWPKYTGNLFSVRINDDNSDSATAVTNTQGLHLATRTASNVKKYRHNTTQILSNTTASSALNVASIYIGASRNNANYSTHQTAFNTIGDGLTDTEAANLFTRVQAFQTALSRQV